MEKGCRAGKNSMKARGNIPTILSIIMGIWEHWSALVTGWVLGIDSFLQNASHDRKFPSAMGSWIHCTERQHRLGKSHQNLFCSNILVLLFFFILLVCLCVLIFIYVVFKIKTHPPWKLQAVVFVCITWTACFIDNNTCIMQHSKDLGYPDLNDFIKTGSF